MYDDSVALNNSNLDSVISLIIEFALIYAELFQYSIQRDSKQFKLAINDTVKRRAIRAMVVSEVHHPNKIGFLQALFQDDVEMTADEFKQRVVKPDCAWIFDDKAIRKRFKQSFMSEELLQDVENQQIIVEKSEKLSLAEWQFLKQMEKKAR